MIQKKLAIGWALEEVQELLDVYNKNDLNKQISFYAKSFLSKEKNWLLKQEYRIVEATEMALEATKKTTKAAALVVASIPFLHPDCFRRFVRYLPNDAQSHPRVPCPQWLY